MAASRENAARLDAHIVFVDESGFLRIPVLRKTWAPRGEAPIVRNRDRRDRISVIFGVPVSPKHRHLGLYFQCYPHDIRHDEVCLFLEHLLPDVRCHVIALWNNASTHKGERVREMCRRFPRLHLEALPAYAPGSIPMRKYGPASRVASRTVGRSME